MFCNYCGDEPCDLELHNPRRLRDLLIDAGILGESDDEWHLWMRTKVGDNAKGKFVGLKAISHVDFFHLHSGAFAEYVRTIL